MLSIQFFLRISEVLSVDPFEEVRERARTLTQAPRTDASMHNVLTRVHSEPEESNGIITIVLGAFDNSLEFEPKGEIFTNYKMK